MKVCVPNTVWAGVYNPYGLPPTVIADRYSIIAKFGRARKRAKEVLTGSEFVCES